MHDDGVRPGRHEEGVQDVGLELGSLGDGAGHDGARRGRELWGRSGTGLVNSAQCVRLSQLPTPATLQHAIVATLQGCAE